MPELENPKWERFCLEYAKSADAKESYKKAGYKPKTDGTAYTNAHRLLKNAKIKKRLSELREEVRKSTIADIVEVQECLSSILRGEDEAEKVTFTETGKEKRVRYVDQGNRIKAAELLAKMQGAYNGGASVSVVVPIICGEEELED